MEPFLKEVAEHYYGKGDVERRCFVFPNRRSMAFFRKYLAEAVAGGQRPIVSPQMLTINDLFFKVSGMHQADRVRQLLDLYECYSSQNPKAEPLDEFIFWGDVIIGDFNDVDKYMVDPKQLFANVADFKQIQDTFSYLTPVQRKAIEGFVSHFNDVSGRLTVDLDTENPDVKGRFLQIWNLLHDLYRDFNVSLASKGLAYEGMVYRSLAEALQTSPVEDVFKDVFDGQSFVFVGLNALNECEKCLLRKLRDVSRAEFCWDYSGDMIQDRQNRSSLFMSENVREFPQAAQWDADGLEVPKIKVLSVSSAVGQAKRLPDILEQVDAKGTETAVVLPDEGLLSSVLNSIPEHIRDINVTMGLPMSGSVFYSMMSDIASIQLHSVCRNDKWYFYHKQVWGLFSNDVFRRAADEETRDVVRRVKESSGYYIPQEELCGTPLLETVFRPVLTDSKSRSREQVRDFGEYLKTVIRTIAPAVASDDKIALEVEYAREYYKCINLLQSNDLEIQPLTYIRLLSQLLSSVSVPFRGEPLKGLQVMGPLEMRALDFRNLIIMSANEGVFPRRSVSSSFIPPELRKGFGLPTYEYQDAVWAYYFYRAISRAETVWLLTDSRTEGLKSGEESRYIKQLEYHFGVPLERYVVKFDGIGGAVMPEIAKTEADVEKIRSVSLSATTVQNYLACPAKFYYGTIKELEGENEVAESIDYGMFGTVFHDMMRNIYAPEIAGNRISREYISSWLKREDEIKVKVKELIVSQLNAMDVTGRNLVVADVIVRYVVKTLQRDLEQMQASGVESFEMLGCELPVYGTFHGQRFKGFIDRLDSFSPGMVRVVDYKTGKVLDDDENIHDGNAESIAEKIFAKDVLNRPKIALQFFIYDMLLQDSPLVKGQEMFNSVYSTSNLFREAPLTVPVNKMFYDAVSERLAGLLEEMYSPDVPFRRTDNADVCAYCDFKTICGR